MSATFKTSPLLLFPQDIHRQHHIRCLVVNDAGDLSSMLNSYAISMSFLDISDPAWRSGKPLIASTTE